MRGSAAGRPSRAGSPSRLLPSKQLVLRIRTCSVAAARICSKRAEGNHACEKVANLGARGDSVAGIDFEGRVLPYAHKAAGEVVSAGAEKQRCHPSSVSGSQLIDSSEARAGADDVDCGCRVATKSRPSRVRERACGRDSTGQHKQRRMHLARREADIEGEG